MEIICEGCEWELRISFYKTAVSIMNYPGIYTQSEKFLAGWIILGKGINS